LNVSLTEQRLQAAYRWLNQTKEKQENVYQLNISGKLLLTGGFDTAAEQHRRLLNHRLLR